VLLLAENMDNISMLEQAVKEMEVKRNLPIPE
jgi:hypothetical protein